MAGPTYHSLGQDARTSSLGSDVMQFSCQAYYLEGGLARNYQEVTRAERMLGGGCATLPCQFRACSLEIEADPRVGPIASDSFDCRMESV